MTRSVRRWDRALLEVLETADADRKAAAAEAVLAELESVDLAVAPQFSAPEKPARPERPELVPPAQVPRRGLGSKRGKTALLHALAHIELNAVDLAADMALRFAGAVQEADRPRFVADWITVMGEEGLHFRLLQERLSDLGARYGDHPAHSGLWDAAEKTKDDLFGRLAVAPMILEARGLDVTPGLIAKLQDTGDTRSAGILERIYRDEIGHVRTGVRWFRTLCRHEDLDPAAQFYNSVIKHYPQGPKRPFNEWARSEAQLPKDWYEGVAP